MKIYNNNIENIVSTYKSNNVKKTDIKKAEIKDKIEISEEAVKMHKNMNEYEKAKEHKIESIKEMINAGTYNIKAEDVAGSMLKGIILNKRI